MIFQYLLIKFYWKIRPNW